MKNHPVKGWFCLYIQIALVTLPERIHRVQTYTWRGEPFTIAFTRFTLGFQVRLERPMRVGNLNAERYALVAELALCHPLHLLAVA